MRSAQRGRGVAGTPGGLGSAGPRHVANTKRVRCAGCDTAFTRIAHVRDRYWLDLQGTRSLRIAAGA